MSDVSLSCFYSGGVDWCIQRYTVNCNILMEESLHQSIWWISDCFRIPSGWPWDFCPSTVCCLTGVPGTEVSQPLPQPTMPRMAAAPPPVPANGLTGAHESFTFTPTICKQVRGSWGICWGWVIDYPVIIYRDYNMPWKKDPYYLFEPQLLM